MENQPQDPEHSQHHRPADQLLAQTPELGEDLDTESETIIMLKPEALGKMVGNLPFRDVLQGLLDSMNIEVTSESLQQLNEEQIHKIYPILDQPSEYGDDWKEEVVNHLSTNPVDIMVVRGKGLQSKLQRWKYYLRDKLSGEGTPEGFVLKNMLHVSDADEFERVHDAIFEKNS